MFASLNIPTLNIKKRITELTILIIGKTMNQPLAVDSSYMPLMIPLKELSNTAKNNMKDFSRAVFGQSIKA